MVGGGTVVGGTRLGTVRVAGAAKVVGVFVAMALVRAGTAVTTTFALVVG
jgi:hypothetical protein